MDDRIVDAVEVISQTRKGFEGVSFVPEVALYLRHLDRITAGLVDLGKELSTRAERDEDG
ncbi:MAG: hypothetical protein AAGK66_08935 [Pseudomonadota bacterium]